MDSIINFFLIIVKNHLNDNNDDNNCNNDNNNKKKIQSMLLYMTSHCRTLVSLPPIDISLESSCKKVTFVT